MLMFAFVIQVTGSATVGSCLLPFGLLVVVAGFLPLRSAIAAAAAAAACLGTGLQTVPVCQPAMMYCAPSTVASCPLSAIGFRCLAFNCAITAPAMLSFAAMAPSILLFVLTSICAKTAFASPLADQAGTNCCGPLVIFPLLNNGFRMSSFPLLNQAAFVSH